MQLLQETLVRISNQFRENRHGRVQSPETIGRHRTAIAARETAAPIKVYPQERFLSTLPPIIAFVGPTAVGKSQLALELAREFSAEIVSADSRQVYRYMDIGTAKPSAQERAAVQHFLIDLVEPDEVYSAQRYRDEALRVLHRIGALGRVAFIVGGTGFYIRTLLDGLSLPSAPPDPELRLRLREEVDRLGARALHERLARIDPQSSARIHPNNVPRVIRALEIVERLGGAVPSQPREAAIPALYLGLTRDRPTLHRIADRRVERQIESGLIEETHLLLEMGYSPESPALQGFGYRQAVSYLRGECTLDEATGAYQRATRQYIRRQMTWFRHDGRIRWLDAGAAPAREARELIAERVAMV